MYCTIPFSKCPQVGTLDLCTGCYFMVVCGLWSCNSRTSWLMVIAGFNIKTRVSQCKRPGSAKSGLEAIFLVG